MITLSRSYVESIDMELGGICGNPLYAEWGIVVIHFWKYHSKPFGYEAKYLVRTMVTYLPTIVRDTLNFMFMMRS